MQGVQWLEVAAWPAIILEDCKQFERNKMFADANTQCCHCSLKFCVDRQADPQKGRVLIAFPVYRGGNFNTWFISLGSACLHRSYNAVVDKRTGRE